MKSWKFIFFVVNSWSLRASWLVICYNTTPYLKPAEIRSIFWTSLRRREEIVSNTLAFFWQLENSVRVWFSSFIGRGWSFFKSGNPLGLCFLRSIKLSVPFIFVSKKFQTSYFLARKFHKSKWFRWFSYPLTSLLEISSINYLGKLHTQSPLHYLLKADYLVVFHAVWFLYSWESN